MTRQQMEQNSCESIVNNPFNSKAESPLFNQAVSRQLTPSNAEDQVFADISGVSAKGSARPADTGHLLADPGVYWNEART